MVKDANRTPPAFCDVLLAGLLGVALLADCDSQGVSTTGFQPQIVDQADNFVFQVSDLTHVTHTVSYTWQDTGTRANITQASQLASGAATLTLRDVFHTPVHSGDLSVNGTFESSAGTAGGWTIGVTLTRVSGTLNFRVQRGN